MLILFLLFYSCLFYILYLFIWLLAHIKIFLLLTIFGYYKRYANLFTNKLQHVIKNKTVNYKHKRKKREANRTNINTLKKNITNKLIIWYLG